MTSPVPPARGTLRGEEWPGSPVLEVQGMDLTYGSPGLPLPFLRRDPKPVVHDVSFSVGMEETFALVGESGSGKTTVARAVAGLLVPTRGHILFEGRDISVPVRQRNRLLLRRIQFVFQNPDASLNPRRTVGYSLGRPLDFFGPDEPRSKVERPVGHSIGRQVEFFFGVSGKEKRQRVEELLDDVHLDGSYINRLPTQLSGGERQRVAIARALAADPKLILCDEVVSALDVSVQASILDLLQELQKKRQITYLFIAHDLAVVRWLAHRVGVLYLGHMLEIGTSEEVFALPWQPYTEMLLQSVPEPDPDHPFPAVGQTASVGIKGYAMHGCPFAPRCPRKVGSICDEEVPPWQQASSTHAIRCHTPIEDLAQSQRPIV